MFTSVNPLYFDNSVFDLYGSVLNGASLVPFDAATISDPYRDLRTDRRLAVHGVLFGAVVPDLFPDVEGGYAGSVCARRSVIRRRGVPQT